MDDKIRPLASSVFTAAILLVIAADAPAQGTGGPVVSDTRVGYIDSAIPATQFRIRFDSAYNNVTPTRAEYFYARPRPLGPGLPDPEPRIDYQDLDFYGEFAVRPCLSLFVEAPLRFLNPEANPNTAGFGDLKVGGKWTCVWTEDTVIAGLLRVYTPTGDASRGLGTHHVSIEPGVLGYHQLTERLALEGEFKYWIPVGGTDFAGDIVRYGLGLNYDLGCMAGVGVAPVVEFVGWTVLDGQLSHVHSNGRVAIDEAAGDTIVNVKIGSRFGLSDRADMYVGYGRSLTGDRWYEDIVRVEFRLFR